MLAEALAQADADERWRYYSQLAGLERTVPHEELAREDEPEGRSDDNATDATLAARAEGLEDTP